MPTWEEWWGYLADGVRYQYQWERWYLDKASSPPFGGSVVEGLGRLNARFHPSWGGLISWDPMVAGYRSYKYFKNHPAPSRDLFLNEHLETGLGLEFYVYLCVSSLDVTYDLIKNNDTFQLAVTCPEPAIVPCRVIDDLPDARWKTHQIAMQWGHHWDFPLLALPIFLRIEPEQLKGLQDIFDAYDVTTLLLDLAYFYRLEQINEREWLGGEEYVVTKATNESKAILFDNLFTLREKKPTRVRFLVASDIHVAERNDIIQGMIGTEEEDIHDPDGKFCNFNEQARRLNQCAYDHWRRGEIDYAILVGDLVDFALKDTVWLQDTDPVAVEIEPTAAFANEPRPYGLGEDGYNIGNLRPWVSNVDAVLEKVGHFGNTNWREVATIFGGTMKCLPTYLVPGNHDYLVLGYEFTGLPPEKFDEFMDAVATGVTDRDYRTLVDLLSTFTPLTRSGAIHLLIALFGQIPGYIDLAQYEDTGLERREIAKYDESRSLVSYYRALLGSLWSEQALAGIGQLGARDSRIPLELHFANGRVVRLAFFDTGPTWNYIANVSPWLRGFPDDEKERNPDIELIERWRNDRQFENDPLILFMHAPPLSRVFPQTNVDRVHGFRFVQDAYSYQTGQLNPNETSEYSTTWNEGMYLTGLFDRWDKVWGAPFHNHRALLMALSPETYWGYHPHWGSDGSTCATQEALNQRNQHIVRKTPVLVFAGHTHWRHVYSLEKTVLYGHEAEGACRLYGCAHFRCGHELLDGEVGLHKAVDKQLWWENKALVLTTGCVGPIPSPDFREEDFPPAHDTPSATPPYYSQGYYIVTVEQGVITRIDWKSLWYRTLTGTSWQATSYYDANTGGMAPVLDGTTLTASFGPDGRLTGSAGCNAYSASYTVDSNALTIVSPTVTDLLCDEPEGIMEQEDAFLAALASAAFFRSEGGGLYIENASGQTMLEFVAVR